MPADGALTPFQREVAAVFFALPAAEGFLLAGGAALVAQDLSDRPTQDLDLFTARADGVPEARDAFESAASARGWESSGSRTARRSAGSRFTVTSL